MGPWQAWAPFHPGMKLSMVISLEDQLGTKSLSLWYQHPSDNGIPLVTASFKYQRLSGMSILRVPPGGCSYLRDTASGPARGPAQGCGTVQWTFPGEIKSH